jgi:hypothetical protein
MLWVLITFGVPLGLAVAIVWWKRQIRLAWIMLLVALTAILLAIFRARLGF